MAFRLNKVINGEQKVFPNRTILEILGDTINDEINIKGKVYRISSFVNLSSGGSGGSSYLWNSINLLAVGDNQVEFYLSNIISDFSNTKLYINGVHYEYGSDKAYHINGRNLVWHGSFNLETSDEIFLKYVTSV